MLAILSKTQDVGNILLISMTLVAAVRATAYYNEDLSRDLAKMLPFALLGIFLIDISFFSLQASIETIKLLPSMWKPMIYYFIFVVGFELLLRILSGISLLITGGGEERSQE